MRSHDYGGDDCPWRKIPPTMEDLQPKGGSHISPVIAEVVDPQCSASSKAEILPSMEDVHFAKGSYASIFTAEEVVQPSCAASNQAEPVSWVLSGQPSLAIAPPTLESDPSTDVDDAIPPKERPRVISANSRESCQVFKRKDDKNPVEARRN
ncbi:hypothetical protein OJAV_G00057750 [Oryzias javanicus]|uniref:Uncharacterized protein n=1 Tax=Oryzias javanicus TaxID=123683 RepID=A0A3S2MBL2_ORYJA|nr:hypothetical protein OJAV_G00057750 [Oryzias javanicus]